jgi:hypothetical protein
MRLQALHPPKIAAPPSLFRTGEDKEAIKAAKRLEKEVQAHEEAARKIRENADEMANEGFRRAQRQYQQDVREHAETVANKTRREKIMVDLVLGWRARGERESNKLAEELHKNRMKTIKEDFEKTMKLLFEMNDDVLARDKQIADLRKESFNEEFKQLQELDRQKLEMQERAIEREKALRMAQLEASGPQLRELTLKEKTGLEQAKLQIEIEFIKKSLAVQQQKLEAERDAAIVARKSQMFLTEEERLRQAAQVEEYYNKQIEELKLKGINDTELERLKTAKQINDLIVADYKKHFEVIKDAASSILDNLLSKTKTWGDVFKAIIKAAILTPIKEAAAKWIAGVLTPRPQGIPGTTGQQGRRSLMDLLREIGGFGPAPVKITTPPTFERQQQEAINKRINETLDKQMEGATKVSASGAQAAAAAADTAAAAAVTAAASARIVADRCACSGPSGSAKALQLAQVAATLAGGSSRGGAGGGGGFSSMFVPPGPGMERYPSGGTGGGGGGGGATPGRLGQLKDIIGLGNQSGVWQGGGTLGKLATSDAAALAGAGLLYAGLKRGGWAGVGMATAGGALVGAKIGTMIAPGIGTAIGAAVGAAAGFTAGMIRKMFKSAEQKVIEQVKSVYSISIDKQMAAQIVAIAKQQYGGNLTMAVHSPAVRELVELYSMSTGQNPTGLLRPMYAVTGSTRGGADYIAPVYSGANIVANPYTGPTTANPTQSGNTFIQLDPQQANDLLEGRVVQIVENNPHVVATANTSGVQAGTNRQTARAAYSEPLTTLA